MDGGLGLGFSEWDEESKLNSGRQSKLRNNLNNNKIFFSSDKPPPKLN